jgi:hypothetical protein
MSVKVQYTARQTLTGEWLLSKGDEEYPTKFKTEKDVQAAVKRLIEKKIVHFDQYGEVIK